MKYSIKQRLKKKETQSLMYQFLFIRFTMFAISSINLLILIGRIVGVFKKATSVICTSVYNRSMDSRLHGFNRNDKTYNECMKRTIPLPPYLRLSIFSNEIPGKIVNNKTRLTRNREFPYTNSADHYQFRT